MDYTTVDASIGESMPFTDDELTALALAAEPITSLPSDAVPWGGGDTRTPSLLPSWYMPSPSYHLRGRWTRAIVITLMPHKARSRASGRVRAATPPFELEYAV